MADDVLWRDSGLAPKIGPLDAQAIFPMLLWLFHWSYWTASIALTGVAILYLVQRTGMTPLACFRALRVTFLGRRRETRQHEIHWRRRCRWA